MLKDTRLFEGQEFADRYRAKPLTNKKEDAMYCLKDKKTDKTALMRDGSPFLYSTEALAHMGAKWLGKKRRTKFRVLAYFG